MCMQQSAAGGLISDGCRATKRMVLWLQIHREADWTEIDRGKLSMA